jgi:uncharacterized protein YdeI (YjbR/CyaY-like superfamily)
MARNRDPRIDAYIKKAAPFAQPILIHLRDLVHQACPGVEETLKWGMPSFVWREKILCAMASFKAHCAFSFWHRGMDKELGTDGAKSNEAMGSLGRIASPADLPKDKAMLAYLKRAVALNESDTPGRPRPTGKPRPESKVPPDLATALKRNKKAATTFAALSPSHRREYVEWIAGAKREETRARRLATTLEWLASGKSMNWKYENC